jgi:branched-chain amino acid aminotransferase
MQQSAEVLVLPVPPDTMLNEMIVDVVRAGVADVPEAPGSLYLRPTLIGTEANIGAAAHPSAEAMLFVLASPVGDYFAGGIRPLALAIETDQPRTTPQFGMVKAGANYAMARSRRTVFTKYWRGRQPER